jgi:hypothetical protein
LRGKFPFAFASHPATSNDGLIRKLARIGVLYASSVAFPRVAAASSSKFKLEIPGDVPF